jgi:hypothetical protein
MLKFIFIALALTAGNAEFDKAAVETAEEISISKVRNEIRTKGPGAGILEKAMLADPKRFASKAVAEEESRKFYIAAAMNLFSNRVTEIRRTLSRNSDVKVEFGKEDLNAVLKNFPDAFKKERMSACARQAREIKVMVRPTAEEFDVTDAAELRKKTVTRILEMQEKPVFEENIAYISDSIVEPMFEEAKKERTRQLEYIRRVRTNEYAPSCIRSDIERKLRENLSSRSKESGELCWDIFPSVMGANFERAVSARVQKMLAERIREVDFGVTDKDLEGVILSNRRAHENTKKSFELTNKVISEKLVAKALNVLSAEAPENQRKEIREFFSKKDNTSKEIASVVQSKIEPEFSSRFSAVRKRLSEKEFAEQCPKLSKGLWYPDAVLADDVAKRSDFKRVVSRWRKLPLRDVRRPKVVFEETGRLVDASIFKAFEIAKSAITCQQKIVDDAADGVLAEVRRRKNSFWTKDPTFKTVVALLTVKTERDWAIDKKALLWPDGDFPQNADEQHSTLFPSTRKHIEMVARMIFEAMEKEEVEQKDSEETEEESLLSISVKKKGGNIELSLERDGETLMKKTVPSDKAQLQKGFSDLSNRIWKEIGSGKKSRSVKK